MGEGLIVRYFHWLCQLAIADPHKREMYSELLAYLFYREFIWSIENDKYRAEYGVRLRDKFGDERNLSLSDRAKLERMAGPCSVLEMMVALADQCEQTIMYDVDYGDRTSVWFWDMVRSMGLEYMSNSSYDMDETEDIITRVLDRDYEPNGHGGMFTVQNPRKDMREVELWYQMNWYADEIIRSWDGGI